MLDNTDLSYIAGFFDGEGCISSTVTIQGYFILNVSITNTNKDVLVWIQSIVGGTLHSTNDKRKTSKKCYWLRFSVNEGPKLVNSLIAFSKVKTEQLKLASLFYVMKQYKHQKEDFYFINTRLKELNKKGPPNA